MNAYFLKLTLALSSLAITSVALAQSNPADEAPPAVVDVPLAKAYIPDGFDSKNRVRMMVEGYFPNTCYRVSEPEVNTSNGAIGITQKAFKYSGPCLDMVVSYSQPVNVGILKASQYSVKDSFSGRVLGELPVKVAKAKAGPDDYFYANIKDAYVGVVDGTSRTFVVTGVLPNNCWRIKEKRVYQDGDHVVTILPIMEQTQQETCAKMEQPFVTSVDIPNVPAGRYMLQVRSLNGESIMKLVDL